MQLASATSRGCRGRRTAPRRPVGLVQAHQRQADRRLARARFADEARASCPWAARSDTSFTALNSRWPKRPSREIEALAEVLAPRARSGRAGITPRARSARFVACRAAVHEVVDHRQARRAPVEPRPAREQRLGVRVLRVLEDLLAPGPARGSRRCASRRRGRRSRRPRRGRGVMNSTDIWCFSCSAAMQLEDLLLDRHVERGRRLVGDQQLRLAGDRHRDHHALLLAARQLRAGRRRRALRLGNADLVQQLDRALARLRAATGPCAAAAPRRSASRR